MKPEDVDGNVLWLCIDSRVECDWTIFCVSHDTMRQALTDMVTKATQKGIKVIIVKPQPSVGYSWGKELLVTIEELLFMVLMR